MAGHAVEHDYHLIDPSPWPFLAGIACLIWGLGMVVFFAGLVPHTDPATADAGSPMMEFFFAKGLDSLQDGFVTFSNGVPRDGGWIILLIGSLFAAYVMIAWWKDVAAESKAGDHTPVVDIGLRYGMIMFIMQEAMFFVPNAAEYADTMAPATHAINPWNLPLMNTVVLLLSGTTVTWAHHALIHNDRKGAKWGLGLTVVLGVFFTFLQGVEYYEAYLHRADGEPWLASNAYGSAFFMATGFHGLHVLIGTIFLAVMYLRLMKGGLRPEKHFGLEAAAWYWHFVDVVWLFLFAFVYIIFGFNRVLRDAVRIAAKAAFSNPS